MMTMTYKASDVRYYNFTPQDKLFLDANIWLYLYGHRNPGLTGYLSTQASLTVF